MDAVPTRVTSSLKRKKLSHDEKERLLRIGKRPRKGPFNAIMDHTEAGAGSALLEMTEAVKQSGSYNVWEEEEAEILDDHMPIPKQAVKVSIYIGLSLRCLFKTSFRYSHPYYPIRGNTYNYQRCHHLMKAPHTTPL